MVRLAAACLVWSARGLASTTRRSVLGGAAGVAAWPLAARADEVRSPRPVSWRIVPGDPPLMQPYVNRAVQSCLKEIAAADVVFLGAKRGDAADYALAAEFVRMLARASRRPVALGLDAAPLGSGEALRGVDWVETAATRWPAVASVGGGDAAYLGPIAALAREGVVDGVVPLGVAAEAMGKVQRSGGIASLSEGERADYVDDVGAFVRYAKQPGFDVYAKRVIERRYKRAGYAGIDGAPAYADFFASSILYDEAVASLAARAARERGPAALVACVVDEAHLTFRYGVQGRLDRLDRDPESPTSPKLRSTSVLLNPTADSTFSASNNLRLSLAADVAVTRPLADYVWFSESPKPSLITHMMNPIDGQFKIDLGLSLPSI